MVLAPSRHAQRGVYACTRTSYLSMQQLPRGATDRLLAATTLTNMFCSLSSISFRICAARTLRQAVVVLFPRGGLLECRELLHEFASSSSICLHGNGGIISLIMSGVSLVSSIRRGYDFSINLSVSTSEPIRETSPSHS